MACGWGALQPLFFDEHSERGRLPFEWEWAEALLAEWWGEATLGDDSGGLALLRRLPVVAVMGCSQPRPA